MHSSARPSLDLGRAILDRARVDVTRKSCVSRARDTQNLRVTRSAPGAAHAESAGGHAKSARRTPG
eukprot:1329379-Pyramimonas_sp.AAC.1